MNNILLYVFKSTICISLFYLMFRTLMRKETFFALNRMLLLAVVVCSTVIPLLYLPQIIQPAIQIQLMPVFPESENQLQTIPINQETITTNISTPVIETEQPKVFSVQQLLQYVYLAGILVSFLILIHGIGTVLLLFRKAQVRQMDGFRLLIIHKEVSPFSFGRFVIISKSDYDAHRQTILAHEQAHIRLNHFYDLLLLEMVKIFHWFNPVIYWIISDLKEIHEFQADDYTLTKGIDATQYQLLIIQKCVGPQRFALANSFNHCQIKKRIIMMNKQKTSKARRWKVATFLPLLALLLMAFGKSGESRIQKVIQNETVNILQPDLSDGNQAINPDGDLVPSESNLVQNDRKNEEAARSEVKQVSQKVIKGKVIDEHGNALEGVSVVGSKRMKTTTDANGNFELAMTEDVPLWFSHAGLSTTARTPPEFEASTIVKMESDPLNLGSNVYKGVKTTRTNQNIQSKNNSQEKTQPIQVVEKMVKGKIIDINEKPLEGASVTVSGKSTGTVTDNEGNFVLNLADGSPIVISYVGFASVKIEPDFENQMTIVLKSENIGIEQVTVVGYGTSKSSKKLAVKNAVNNNEVFTVVEQMPEFPGGALALRKYIAQQIKYPFSAQEDNVQGKVFVSFVINSYGAVSNVEIAKSVNPALDNEAKRVVYTMPKWKPGFQHGKAVDVAYTIPIEFILQYDPPQPLAK